MGRAVQTPLTDEAVQQTYEETDEMKFVLSIYSMSGCKENLNELFEMTLSDLISLREFLEVRSSYKEEIAYNEYRKAGNN